MYASMNSKRSGNSPRVNSGGPASSIQSMMLSGLNFFGRSHDDDHIIAEEDPKYQSADRKLERQTSAQRMVGSFGTSDSMSKDHIISEATSSEDYHHHHEPKKLSIQQVRHSFFQNAHKMSFAIRKRMHPQGGEKHEGGDEGDLRGADVFAAGLTDSARERRENLRNQSMEDSPYIEDAEEILKKGWENTSDTEMEKSLTKLCYLCWIGGKIVQDMGIKYEVISKLHRLVQGRSFDPSFSLATQSGLSSHLRKVPLKKNLMKDDSSKTSDLPKVTFKGSMAVLRTIASVCRDHPINVRHALNIGLCMDLVKFVINTRVSAVEKKWALHCLAAILVASGAGQETLLKSSHASVFRKNCTMLRKDSDWKNWPHNEAQIIMQLLAWERIEEQQ